MHAANRKMNVATFSNGQMTPILVTMGGGVERHLGAQHLEGGVQVGCWLFSVEILGLW
jgi:hypothetical protein